jgi:hypothetical protein
LRAKAGVVAEPTNTGEVALQAGQRLVNLTEHDVRLIARPRNGDDGMAEPPLACIAAEGRFARVDDEAARLRENLLDTECGVVRLTWLRRSARLADLPGPRAGTRFVVSRVTALAARDRSDLVFPFEEIRDEHGRVTGTRRLASFRPRPAVWRLPGAWRAAARERRRDRPPDRQTLTGVLFAVATALLSGALSLLPSALDQAKSSGWGAAWASWTLRLTVVFTVCGLAALAGAAWRWHRRGVMLEARGTSYVIEEQAVTWRHEEKESVLADVGEGFAAVLRVPGPAELGSNWRWEADARAAPQWDARVDELVSSFWAVHYNDSQITRNAVFVWAPWPVAMAFGARATARRRGLVLHVRQRPSYGAAGPHRRPRLNDAAHDFLRHEGLPVLADKAALHEPVVFSEMVTMTIKPLGAPLTGQHGGRDGHGNGQSLPDAGDSDEGPLLLIVRVTQGAVGPIPLDLARTEPFTVHVSPGLAGREPRSFGLVSGGWRRGLLGWNGSLSCRGRPFPRRRRPSRTGWPRRPRRTRAGWCCWRPGSRRNSRSGWASSWVSGHGTERMGGTGRRRCTRSSTPATGWSSPACGWAPNPCRAIELREVTCRRGGR